MKSLANSVKLQLICQDNETSENLNEFSATQEFAIIFT